MGGFWLTVYQNMTDVESLHFDAKFLYSEKYWDRNVRFVLALLTYFT